MLIWPCLREVRVLHRLRDVIATLRRHRQDPEDVAKGVHMIDALGALLGRGDRTMPLRMKASEQGRRILEARSATGGQVPGATPEVAFLNDRYRDLHDIWHVVTGYGTDLAGEYGIVALQSQQVGYRAMLVMGFLSMLMTSLAERHGCRRRFVSPAARADQ
jgi:hypothetical protein